jgi:hypothetical protein
MKKKIFTFLFLIAFFSNLQAQQNSNTYTLQELKSKFRHANYTDKVLLDFQKTIANLSERPQLNEEIPGQIISWDMMMGRFAIHKTYLIQNNKIKEVETLPKDDAFLKKLNSYVPEQSKFSYSSDDWSYTLIDKKLAGGFYLIKVTAKSFNSYPEIPSDDILVYDLEYKTKDFKEFRLVRLKDIHTQKWIDVAAY